MSDIQLKRKVSLKPKQPNNDTSGKKRTWLWILLAILVIVGIVVAIVLSTDKKDKGGNPSIGPGTDTTIVAPGENPTPADSVTEDVVGPVVAPSPESEGTQEGSAERTPEPTRGISTTPVSTSLSDNLEENAMRTIRGDFGNGQDRKDVLGASYTEIQNRVNEIYREKYNK